MTTMKMTMTMTTTVMSLRSGNLAILRNLLTPLLRDGEDCSKALKLVYWITATALSENNLVQMLLEDVKAER